MSPTVSIILFWNLSFCWNDRVNQAVTQARILGTLLDSPLFSSVSVSISVSSFSLSLSSFSFSFFSPSLVFLFCQFYLWYTANHFLFFLPLCFVQFLTIKTYQDEVDCICLLASRRISLQLFSRKWLDEWNHTWSYFSSALKLSGANACLQDNFQTSRLDMADKFIRVLGATFLYIPWAVVIPVSLKFQKCTLAPLAFVLWYVLFSPPGMSI